jgi:hypothetical protein
MDRPGVTERIEQLFANGLRAETAAGIAARLGIGEDEALVSLVSLVVEEELILLEEGALLIFLTPARLRELEPAA